MKDIIFLITVILFFGSCCNNNQQISISDRDDVIQSDFAKFIKEFEEKKLPDSLTVERKLPWLRFSIPWKNTYIQEFTNFHMRRKSISWTRYWGVYAYKFSNEARAIVYYIHDPFDQHYILATYNEDEDRFINKLIIFGTDNSNYLIQSWISKEGVIKIKSIYDGINRLPNQFEDYPEYRIISVVDEIYQISPNGIISLLEQKVHTSCLAKKIDGKYIYPIEPPDDRKWTINPM